MQERQPLSARKLGQEFRVKHRALLCEHDEAIRAITRKGGKRALDVVRRAELNRRRTQAQLGIGVVRVAFFAATSASSPIATMTFTLASTSSRARTGSFSGRPSAKRYSTSRSLPSEYPSSLIRFWKNVGGVAPPKPR